ncbi:MAG: hypothetical protein ACI9YB_001887, partial [Halioglobus sp.]
MPQKNVFLKKIVISNTREAMSGSSINSGVPSHLAPDPYSLQVDSKTNTATLKIKVGGEDYDVEFSVLDGDSPIGDLASRVQSLVKAIAADQTQDGGTGTYQFDLDETSITDVSKEKLNPAGQKQMVSINNFATRLLSSSRPSSSRDSPTIHGPVPTQVNEYRANLLQMTL